MAGGRKDGYQLRPITDEDKRAWPPGLNVWYPNGAGGWLKGQVIGYSPKFVSITTTRGSRNAVPYKLRVRVNDVPPTESPY